MGEFWLYLKEEMMNTALSKRVKGQSTVEYLVLVGVVVALFIVFLNGTFNTELTNTLDQQAGSMSDMSQRVVDSMGLP